MYTSLHKGNINSYRYNESQCTGSCTYPSVQDWDTWVISTQLEQALTVTSKTACLLDTPVTRQLRPCRSNSTPAVYKLVSSKCNLVGCISEKSLISTTERTELQWTDALIHPIRPRQFSSFELVGRLQLDIWATVWNNFRSLEWEANTTCMKSFYTQRQRLRSHAPHFPV